MSALPSLRLLQAHELAAVAGGDIIVNGPRPSEPIDPRLLDALRFNFNMVTIEELGLGTGGLATPAPDTGDGFDPDGDDDEDGISNGDEEIVVTADRSDILETQALRQLAESQATGIMFSLAVALGWERVGVNAVMAVLTSMFGSARVAGALAAGAGFVAGEVTQAALADLLTQIHLNDWEADGREIAMPQPGDWDYIGDPRYPMF